MPGMHGMGSRARRSNNQLSTLRSARVKILESRSAHQNPQDPDQAVDTRISHQELAKQSRVTHPTNYEASAGCSIM
ncbi:MAG: hypothetical protein MK137_09985 [Rickettsiales bacterium]|nr:hypothetical protein [Rickettsiales bacterium]